MKITDDMIKYRETYEVYTEQGGSAENGFTHDPDVPFEADFREMVELLEGTSPSDSDVSIKNYKHVWYTRIESNKYTREWFETGNTEDTSYHPVSDRDARYMAKAWLMGNTR